MKKIDKNISHSERELEAMQILVGEITSALDNVSAEMNVSLPDDFKNAVAADAADSIWLGILNNINELAELIHVHCNPNTDDLLNNLAKICEGQIPEDQTDEYRRGQRRGVIDCVETIRKLMSTSEHKEQIKNLTSKALN